MAVGELLVHARLEVAVGALALEQGVAEEKDAVAILDFKRLGGAERGEAEEQTRGKERTHGGTRGTMWGVSEAKTGEAEISERLRHWS